MRGEIEEKREKDTVEEFFLKRRMGSFSKEEIVDFCLSLLVLCCRCRPRFTKECSQMGKWLQ